MIPDEKDGASSSSRSENDQKKPKRGIIYISSIPPYMNVSQIREYFGEFGEIGRVYLQLQDKERKGEKPQKKKKKAAKKFTEGWIEFEKKSIAKRVAQTLNNTQVSNRKKSIHYDYLWSLKYLSGFKWTHLHERLAYEKAAKRQKLRAEIQLAKRNAAYFTSNLNKKNKDEIINKEYEDLTVATSENNTDKTSESDDRKEFLGSLFS